MFRHAPKTRRAVKAAAGLSIAAGLCASGVLPANAASKPSTTYPTTAKIDLRVLLLTDGSAPIEAIRSELDTEGVPYTAIDLTSSSRPVLTAAYLASTSGSAPEAYFQAVVLPNNAPSQLSAAEISALNTYETTYSIRQVDAYDWASPAVGLNYAQYSGTLDGMTATVTADGKANAFPYLNGSVPFENIDPNVSESYGYLATANPAAGTTFDPFVTMTVPGGSTQGVLSGVYTSGGRSELVNTFAYNGNQAQYRALAHGFITWMTQGVHFGYDRNYLTIDVDDTFLPDAEWSQVGHCTPGDTICPAGTPDTTASRMVPADVTYEVDWEAANNFKLTMLYNGGGSDDQVAATGSDPLLTAWQANADNVLEWLNHTYSHEFLGCEQNLTTIPWSCETDANGNYVWVPQSDIVSQVQQNIDWAHGKGLPIHANELVTGEHSGLATLPQQAVDNPNLAPGLAQTGIAWTGSDASREPNQRTVGTSTLTVPRHPMNIYYNAATVSDEINEYNWIYTSTADGGSGLCENNPTSTCITPLDPATGYASYIVPTETRIALGHVTANDPRPTYVHQSNLTQDRILYPALNSILSTYRAEFAGDAPIVSTLLGTSGQILQQQAAWSAAVAAGKASGYIQSGKVTVSAPSGLYVPLTAPTGTQNAGLLGGSIGATPFGSAYAGELSAYQQPPALGNLALILPGSGGLVLATRTSK
jgi:hypothetical protein